MLRGTLKNAGSNGSILGVVLAGDERLPEMPRSNALVPLGSRIRTREELAVCLGHRLRAAG